MVQPNVIAARKRCRGDESRQKDHVAQFNKFHGRLTAQPDALNFLGEQFKSADGSPQACIAFD